MMRRQALGKAREALQQDLLHSQVEPVLPFMTGNVRISARFTSAYLGNVTLFHLYTFFLKAASHRLVLLGEGVPYSWLDCNGVLSWNAVLELALQIGLVLNTE